jgi:hypothetical protein
MHVRISSGAGLRAETSPARGPGTFGSPPDQDEESLERAWVTALKIPMPSNMTHVIIT